MLFAAYYGHILDRSAWFYSFRAVPDSELAAAGLGLGIGLLAGAIQRAAPVKNSLVFQWILPGALLFCLVLVLFVPYAKTVIAPIQVELLDQWSDGVCIQTKPSACGPSSAATILRHFGIAATERELARECFSYGGGTENWYIARAIRNRGLDARYFISSAQPQSIEFPSIAGTELGGRGGAGHFVAILRKDGGKYTVGDPIAGRLLLTREQLETRFYLTGFFLVVKPRS